MKDSVALVVLVGGQGRRLGGLIKPLLRHPQGDSLFDRIYRVYRPLVQEYWAVAPQDLAPYFPAPVYLDPGEGPAAALLAVAGQVQSPWLFLVGGDHPRPNAALFSVLWAARGGCVVIDDGGTQPLGALYPTEALQKIQNVKSLRGVLAALPTTTLDAAQVAPAARDALLDVDDAEAAARYQIRI